MGKHTKKASGSLIREISFFVLVLAVVFAFEFSSAEVTQRPAVTIIEKSVNAPENLHKKIEQEIRKQIASRMGRDVQEFEVSIESLQVNPPLKSEVIQEVQVLALGSQGSNRLDGLFSLPIVVVNGARQSQEVQARGILKVLGPVAVAAQNLPRGHLVTKNDFTFTKMPWRLLPSGAAATSENEILNQRVKALVSAGSPLYAELLDAPLDVRAGDLVELTLNSGPGVIIRSRAIARQEGRLGDLINIEQPDTKKKMTGVVRGLKAVEVNL